MTPASILTLCWAATMALAQQPDVPVPAAPAFPTDDPVAHGQALANYADTYDQGWVDDVLQGEMTLFDAGGDSVRRTFTRMVLEQPKEGDKIITKFLSPAEIKGVAALTHENPGSSDDNWLYLPANKRVRRISGANNTASFQGTEFTYEDLSNLDPVEYDWRFLETSELKRGTDSVPVHRLEARPTYEDTGYSKLIVSYHREHYGLERIEYFDKAGRLLKTREATGWKQHHGRFWRPDTIRMENHQTGKSTELVVRKQYLNLSKYKSSRTGKPRPNLTADRFTTRALEG